ncbi:MerR family transcriptional regulator [Saccharopolyspora sp. NPDC002376]
MGSVCRISEFARRVGRSSSTVRRWGNEGRIAPKRTVTGQWYFAEGDVRAALGIAARGDRVTVVYCRVSSPGQKDGLASRVSAMDELTGGGR